MDDVLALPHVGTQIVDDLSLFCHDLRQLVSAGLLVSRHPGDELLPTSLRERLCSLDEIFQQLSTMIRVAEDVEPHVLQPLDLGALVTECVKVVRLNHRASIVIDAEDGVRTCGSSALLRRALMNLLDNGARAAGPDGVVHVGVRARDGFSVVEIADDGRGWGRIPRLSGRGLASVAMALSRCHGELEVPPHTGRGATVRIVLPIDVGVELQ